MRLRLVLLAALSCLVASGCNDSSEVQICEQRVKSLERDFRSFRSDTDRNMDTLTRKARTTASKADINSRAGILLSSSLDEQQKAVQLLSRNFDEQRKEAAEKLRSTRQEAQRGLTKGAVERLALKRGLTQEITRERSQRVEMYERLAGGLKRTGGDIANIRSAIRSLLEAELDLMIALIETKQMLNDLKKQGKVTEKEIRSSKVARLEDKVWAQRIKEIQRQLSALPTGAKTRPAE